MVFQRGTSFAQNSKMSVTSRSDGAGGEDVRAARRILFQDVVLNRAIQLRPLDAAALGDDEQQREENRGRRVDRHRDRHFVERNLGKQRLHVIDRVDGDADLADFAAGAHVVRVHADLRR